jgi:hypothetical protein
MSAESLEIEEFAALEFGHHFLVERSHLTAQEIMQ